MPWKDVWARERFAKSSSAPIERTGEEDEQISKGPPRGPLGLDADRALNR
jgi:hypothetical protein